MHLKLTFVLIKLNQQKMLSLESGTSERNQLNVSYDLNLILNN